MYSGVSWCIQVYHGAFRCFRMCWCALVERYLKLQGELVGRVFAHLFEVRLKVVQLHQAATRRAGSEHRRQHVNPQTSTPLTHQHAVSHSDDHGSIQDINQSFILRNGTLIQTQASELFCCRPTEPERTVPPSNLQRAPRQNY